MKENEPIDLWFEFKERYLRPDPAILLATEP